MIELALMDELIKTVHTGCNNTKISLKISLLSLKANRHNWSRLKNYMRSLKDTCCQKIFFFILSELYLEVSYWFRKKTHHAFISGH